MLNVEADGRTSNNWSTYKVQLENALAAKEVKGISLDEVLLNVDDGAQPINPGADVAVWVAMEAGRTADQYATALASFKAWAKANKVAHGYVMGTLPVMLYQHCAQRLVTHELWAYLNDLFGANTLSSTAALCGRMMMLRLENFGGVSAYLTALTKVQLELEQAGANLPEFLLAGLILIGIGDRFPTTKELLLQLPLAEQTKAVFGGRLLEAEKNAQLSADLALLSVNTSIKPSANANATTTFSNKQSGGCGYIRKFQGRWNSQTPGTKCIRGTHRRNQCYAFLDDQFMESNPGKGPEDLPDRRQNRGKAQQARPGAQANAVETSGMHSACIIETGAGSLIESGFFLDYTCASSEEQVDQERTPSEAQVTVVLDSGATTSCFKDGSAYKSLPQPITVRGATASMSSVVKGTTRIPCPALPAGELRGLHSSDFRHNLASVSDMQRQGVETVFPAFAKHAECRDPATGQTLLTFRQGPCGLYEAELSSETAAVAGPSCDCGRSDLLHPTVLLHHRLGHLGEASLQLLIKHQSITGLPQTYKPPQQPLHSSCLPCIQGKSQAKPHPLIRSRAEARLDKVHMDLAGPLPSNAMKGERYWLTIVDDCSRFGFTILLHTKAQAKQRIIEWIAAMERESGLKLKHLHSDRGGEFLNNVLKAHFAAHGIKHTYSNPGSPEQNGVAEARNKTVSRIARTLLLQSGAPQALWGYAITHATTLNNLVPHGLLGGSTPYEVFRGIKPSMRRLKVWGSTGHVLLNAAERRSSGGKLGPVTKACVHVGLNPNGPGWILLDPATNREIPSSDVVFQEDTPFYTRDAQRDLARAVDWLDFAPDAPSVSDQPPAPASALAPSPPVPVAAPPNADIPRPTTPPQDAVVDHQEASDPLVTGGEQAAARRVSFADLPEPSSLEPRRSLRQQGIRPPAPDGIVWQDPPPSASTVTAVVSPSPLPQEVWALLQDIVKGESGDKRQEIPTPNTWKEALEGEHAAEWLEAMTKEISGLQETGTFEQVPRPSHQNVVKCKWVFRVKRRPDGTPYFKARLVAKGFSQREGIDYHATWAPTAKQSTARMLFHLAASKGYLIHAMDVDQAFLHGHLNEVIFMEAAPGVTSSSAPGMVWRLKRPLYGLKQSPREWHAKLKEVLTELGYEPVHGDPSLFLGKGPDGAWILVYVDDLLLVSNSADQLAQLKKSLSSHFPMKDLGEVESYLGMEVSRDWEKGEIYLSQQKYINTLLARFDQEGITPAATPLAVNHNLQLPSEGEAAKPEDDQYAELLGGIMYLMVCTRPDIAHAVSVLSRYVAPGRHGPTHWKAALRLLAYLKGTSHYRLALGGAHISLFGHSDSSWADDPLERKSSQGHCFSLGSGVISWKANRSATVALSSCEAELYAGAAAAQEALWLSSLLELLGIPQQPPPMLWCDNKSTVALTQDPIFSARSKHIEARYFFIRELINNGRLRVAHISGKANVADIFTKPLSQEDHHRLLHTLGLRASPLP